MPIAEARPELFAALGTLAVASAQWITAHVKGKKRDRSQTSELREIRRAIGTLADEQRSFAEEQRETCRLLDKRIDAVSAHVIGPDGKNGLRSRVESLEEAEERRTERELNPIPASRVGTFDRRA